MIRSVPVSAALNEVVTSRHTIAFDVIRFHKLAQLLRRPPSRIVSRDMNALTALLALLMIRKHSLLSWADALDPCLSNALHG